MREWQSLSHVRWYCRYHVVFVPKYRKRSIFGQLRKDIGRILRELCVQQEVELVEGHAMPDHVHLLLSIPPKYSVSNTVGFVKGKSAIQIHRQFLGRERNFTGFHFWARGYCVSTVGLDEAKIRAYIRDQEEEEKRQEVLPFGGLQPPSRGRPGA
ncbi:MAG TPA: IS200/IS605 family transposase [Polyangiales bacterium]